MSVIPVSALPRVGPSECRPSVGSGLAAGRGLEGGRWGQLGSREPWVSPKPGFGRAYAYPRPAFRMSSEQRPGPRWPVRSREQPRQAFNDGQRKNSYQQQAGFRQQVLDIIRIDREQKTPTNQAGFMAAPSTLPSRAPPVPLRIFLPEADAPYPVPFQPTNIGRSPALHGARAGWPGAAGNKLYGGAFRRHKRKRSLKPARRVTLLRDRKGRFLKRSRSRPRPRPRPRSQKRRPSRKEIPARPPPRARTSGGWAPYVGGGHRRYRRPASSIDHREQPGERLWQVDSLPVPAPQPRSPPLVPPAVVAEEVPRRAVAPPQDRSLERAAYVPKPLYYPRALAYEQSLDRWNQPACFYMPATTNPSRPSALFDALKLVNTPPLFGVSQ